MHTEPWSPAGVRAFCAGGCAGGGRRHSPRRRPEASAGRRGVSALRGDCGGDAGPPEPRTHLAAPPAEKRRGARRSGNSPVRILGLFHTFSPIKAKTRHMIIKKKISVPPLQTTAVQAFSCLPQGRAHIRGRLSPPPGLPYR